MCSSPYSFSSLSFSFQKRINFIPFRDESRAQASFVLDIRGILLSLKTNLYDLQRIICDIWMYELYHVLTLDVAFQDGTAVGQWFFGSVVYTVILFSELLLLSLIATQLLNRCFVLQNFRIVKNSGIIL